MTPQLPPTSAFAGDDGAPDPRLVVALDAWRTAGTATAVVEALRAVRVLVPVLARTEAAGLSEDGLVVDMEASAGVVAVRTPDGRPGLPIFSGTRAMAAWHPGARPVPAEGPRAAAAAVEEGWEVLVLDPAGPVPFLVPRPAVRALAGGSAWVPATTDGVLRVEVGEAVARALARVPEVRTVHAEPGRRSEVAVVLGLAPGLDRAGLDRVLARAGEALAGDDVVTTTVDSLELRIVAAT